MTDSSASPRPESSIVRPAWVWAGCLALLSVLPPLLGPVIQSVAGLSWITPTLLAAALLLLAFGRDSVVARRPLGTTALIVLAVWPLVSNAVNAIVLQLIRSGADVSAFSTVIDDVLRAVGIAAGILTVVQVLRAGVIPSALRWVPVTVFALWVVPPIVLTLVSIALPLASAQWSFFLVAGIVNVAMSLGTLILGVTAIVGGVRLRIVRTGSEEDAAAASALSQHKVTAG